MSKSNLLLLLLFCSLFLSNISEAKAVKVKVIVDEDYPPYSYAVNGNPQGIYINLIRKAANLLKNDYDIQFEAMPWKRALKEIELGHAFAILPPYIHRQARPYIGPYSVTLLTERVVTVCHPNTHLSALLTPSNLDLKDFSNRKPLNVGINAGYLMFDDRYKALIKSGAIKIWENKSTQSNLQKLIEKKLDCYVNDSRAIQFNLAQMPSALDIQLVEVDEISRQTAHIGFSNSEHIKFAYKEDLINKLNQAILTIKEQYPEFKD